MPTLAAVQSSCASASPDPLDRAQLRVRREPEPGGAADAADLDGVDHLERIAEAVAALRLHLDERHEATAARDEVELSAAEPPVVVENAVAVQAVPARGTDLGLVSRRRRGLRARRP